MSFLKSPVKVSQRTHRCPTWARVVGSIKQHFQNVAWQPRGIARVIVSGVE